MNKKRFFEIILGARNRHLFILDIIILSLTPFISLLLRCDTIEEVLNYTRPLVLYTVISLFLKITAFYFFNFYNQYWRYASVDEIALLSITTLTSWCLCIMTFFLVLKPAGVLPMDFPRSMPFIDGILTILLIGGVRIVIRMVFSLNEKGGRAGTTKNVLIVGAGVAGSLIVKELHSNPKLGIKPVSFVDDNPAKQGLIIHGVEVKGSLSDIPSLLKVDKIDEVIIAMPTAPGHIIREVVQSCIKENVNSITIPGIFEIIAGSVIAQLRGIRIEDLLRRGTVTVDTKNVRSLIYAARVMVTGAGGSIGSELCRQIISLRPKEIILLGHGENSIFNIANELRRQYGIISEPVIIHEVIADIRDRDRLSQVIQFYRPQIILHAAAHKHVNLMENNVIDAVTNNVLGTQILIELARQYNVDRFVMISSDKAINPGSIMGVTKRIAELVVCDAHRRSGKIFVVVRFGNVLGSRGSVIPLFQQQINNGGPLMITHPDASRYFMTVPEAVQLVLQAATMGKGGEIFVLDMGTPIKILDIAKDLLRLNGLKEGVDIDIVYTGLQKGEKMHEEMFYETEKPVRSSHEKIFLCSNESGQDVVDRSLKNMENRGTGESIDMRQDINRLVEAAQAGKIDLVRHLLKKIVPQYSDDYSSSKNHDDPID